ncbi:bifunctional TH2 protein, mitochondrial isoform X1 [Lactuca sativa]|uniref:bifunctional TH2 protein, mitochondrial isoform X1 n=2 Tax=Lactuca sativa TaxID=4236 RepID=UPI000CD914D3|nr:bifunctional TH2 protein, mitochondrial isoform X1 [Lactuca sativa]
MRLFLNKPSFSIPINIIRSAFFNSNRRYPLPVKNHNLNFFFRRISSMATTPKPNEEGAAKRFWDKFSKESNLTLYTPFVVSLASGNLKIDTFGHYVAQDVHFFKCFAQAYELAEDCADDDDAKDSIVELRKNVLYELRHHASFVQEWGVDLSKETTPNAATTKYTNFLLATASGKVEGVKGPGELATPFEKTKVAAYTLSAMAPFMRLYVFLGNELKSFVDVDGDEHPYKKLIHKYSSESYQATMLQIEDLLDKLSVSLTGQELDTMQKLYHQALKLEMEFFLAQPLHQPTVLPLSKQHIPSENQLMIFSDFDLTCSVVDSSAILAEIAIVTAPKSDQSQPESQSQSQIVRMPSADLRNTWEMLSKEYTEEYEQCMESMLANEKVESFEYEGLKKAVEELVEFERKANMKVIESEVLKGLNLEDIKRAGERLIMLDGCMGFFQSIINNQNLNVNVHVLSYCWCADLIRSAFSSGGLHQINIHANEFEYQNSLSTGEIIKKVESPIDKLQAFTNILKNNPQTGPTNLTIYIGDSVGDLLCLLEADIGIVIGSSSSLRRIGTHFGVSFVPLFPSLVKKQKECIEGSSFKWKGLSGVLYTVSSWAEVHSFIIGL